MNPHKKILIIDDDARNIFALTATLKARGYTCLSAPGAIEGREQMLSHGNIGIILMDMMMPDMDGYEAIPYIRALKGYESIPIIAVTAQAMVGDREKCLEAGATEYISKPVDVDRLMEVLNHYLR
ncbi:MAG: response regulator [Bacteroidia bacterium]